ncbi:MAG: hypothetical protein IJ088_16245 [Clostridia bacterium]|nr:hypothetical protein [Clostridia bacterium]
MAVLDESGLGILWERICAQIGAFFGSLSPDKLVITDSGGKLVTSAFFGVRLNRQMIFEATASAGEGMPMGLDTETLYVTMPEEDLSVALETDQVTLSIDGQSRRLLRRHYGEDPAQDPCMLFGNTRYSGIGIPAFDSQTDTGEDSMVFYMDGILGVVLPDSDAHTLWIGQESAALTVEGTPEQDSDLVTLKFYRDNLPITRDEGKNSLIQQTGLASASGEGAMAINAGTARGRMSFAAGSGTAEGEYAHSAGVGCESSGRGSAAFGIGTKAVGSGSAAFGSGNVANARNAGVFGSGTYASGEDQVVFGRYNSPDTEGEYVEVAGIGQSGSRANGRTLDWNGNEWLAGTLETDALILRESDGTRVRITVRSGQLVVEPMEE